MNRRFVMGVAAMLALSGCGNTGTTPAADVTAAPVPTRIAATDVPATVAQPTAAASSTEAPSAPTSAPGTSVALPAPLYAVLNGQVARIAPDGTSTAITTEQGDAGTLAVTELAVSPDGSRLAYVTQRPGSGNTLVVTDATGQGRTVVFDQANASPSQPVWAPDGSTVLFAATESDASGAVTGGGLYAVGADGSNQRLIQANSLMPAQPSNDLDPTLAGYSPQAVSPDGTLLLVSRYSLQVELCGLAILPIAGGEPVLINPPDPSLRGACGPAAWSSDSKRVFVSFYPTDGGPFITSAGIWQADALTGAASPLVPSTAADGTVTSVLDMQGTADGNLVALLSSTPALPTFADTDPLAFRIDSIDAATGELTPLHETPIQGYFQAFWAPDGSGVVLQEYSAEGNTLTWVPASNEPAQLIATGLDVADLAWGAPGQ